MKNSLIASELQDREEKKTIIDLELNILALNKECMELKQENELLKMTIENLPLDQNAMSWNFKEKNESHELHHDLVFMNASKAPFIHISNFGKWVAAEGGKGICWAKINATEYKLKVLALTTLKFGFGSSEDMWTLDYKGWL